MRPDVNHFLRPRRPPIVGDIARRLRGLPDEACPPYDFAEFQRRSRERAAPKRQIVTWPHAAAAAGLTAVVAAMAMLGTSGGTRRDAQGGETSVAPTAAVSPDTSGQAPTRVATVAPGGSAVVSTLTPGNGVTRPAANDDPAELAREAREWLAHQPAEPAIARAGPRLAVAGLEDRIAWFDDALTDERLRGANPAQLKLLQQERARLVSSLAQVRYAEALVADGS